MGLSCQKDTVRVNGGFAQDTYWATSPQFAGSRTPFHRITRRRSGRRHRRTTPLHGLPELSSVATSSHEFPPSGAGASSRSLRRLRRGTYRTREGRAPHGPSVHLSHARSDQDLSGQPQGPGEHQPVVLSGRQDRRARRQRLGQVDPAAHHGRHRHRIRRRGLGRRGRARRLPAAGAAARCRQERARQRHGGRRGQEGAARPLQRDRRQLLGRDRRRDVEAAGPDRQPEPLGPRFAGDAGDGRAALPARRCRRDNALGRRAPPRRALPAAAGAARPAAARRADQPSRRRDR